MSIYDAASKVAGLLWPPRDASSEELYNWRVAVSSSILLLIFGFSIHLVMAKGLFPDFYKGVATVYDMEVVGASLEEFKNDWKKSRVRQIVAEILDHKIRQCEAKAAGRIKSSDMHLAAIEELKEEYKDLTGLSYNVTACVEIR